MSRPLRIEYSNALYHVTARGNAKQKIYLNNTDYEAFLKIISRVKERYNLICYAYCLMPNHYHLLIETPEANLSQAMRQLNGVYTQKFNFLHHRVGHIFQGRYKAILVEKDQYLAELIRYIILNPIRARLSKTPGEWQWSSHHELIAKGKSKARGIVDAEKALAVFREGETDPRTSFKRYLREKIRQEADDSIWANLKGDLILGSENFIDKIKLWIKKESHDSREISGRQRNLNRPSLDTIFKNQNLNKDSRNKLLYQASTKHGYSLTEISKHTGLHYSTISKIIKRQNSQFKT